MVFTYHQRRHHPAPLPLERRQDDASLSFEVPTVQISPGTSVLGVSNVNSETLIFDTRVQTGRTDSTAFVNGPLRTDTPTADGNTVPSATDTSTPAPAQSVPIQTLVGVCVGVIAILAILIALTIWWSKKHKAQNRGRRGDSFHEVGSSASHQQRGAPRRSFTAPGDASFLSLELDKGERFGAAGRDRELSKKRSKEQFYQDNELTEMDHSRTHAQREIVSELTNPFRTPPRTRSDSSAHTDSTYSHTVGKKTSEKDLKSHARTERQRDMIALDALIDALDNAANKNPGQRYEAPRGGRTSIRRSLSADSDFPLPPPEVFRAALGRHSRDDVP